MRMKGKERKKKRFRKIILIVFFLMFLGMMITAGLR